MHPSSPLAHIRRDAQALCAAGEPSAARTLIEQALEAARARYGEADHEVLVTAHLLARLHREADDPAAARRVLEEALDAGCRRLGAADPLILAISFDLGAVADELGNRHEARRNFQRVATAGPAVLGDDHPTVRAAQAYLDDRNPAALPIMEPLPAPPPGPSVAPARPAGTLSPAPSPPAAPDAAAVPPAPPFAAPGPARIPPLDPPSPYPSVETSPRAKPSWRSRGPMIATVGIATLAIVAAVLALVVTLTSEPGPVPAPDESDPGPGPTLADDPPTDLRLTDNGTTVTITWTDPTTGTVPFIVAGGRVGQPLGALATIDPGEKTYTVNGLNPRLDYCFTVLAVYGTDRYATSGQVCTDRQRATPQPSITRQ